LEVYQVIPTEPTGLSASKGKLSEIGSTIQFLIALGGTIGFLAFLILSEGGSGNKSEGDNKVKGPRQDMVQVAGYKSIRVATDSSMAKKIQFHEVKKKTFSEPLMKVTGHVVASHRPSKASQEYVWHFDSSEVVNAFNDWQKAQADFAYSQTQLSQVKQLAKARLDAQKLVVTRMEKLVNAGTDTPKDLAAEKANLIQFEISSQKEIHDTETLGRVAKRAEAAAIRQLGQAGLEPEMLRLPKSDLDIVMADVPEGRLDRVKIGQACEASFLGIPNEIFQGRVNAIAPSLSKERKTLRVLFAIIDPKDHLHPGMFAEIGLGTEARQNLVAPAESILHINRSDYILVAGKDNLLRVAEVQIGEPHLEEVEILGGLLEGDRIVANGAILFKPVVIRSLVVPTETVSPMGGI
jgi:hypothetical protein